MVSDLLGGIQKSMVRAMPRTVFCPQTLNRTLFCSGPVLGAVRSTEKIRKDHCSSLINGRDGEFYASA